MTIFHGEHRAIQDEFRDWLIKARLSGAAQSYPPAINRISAHYSEQTGQKTDIYALRDADVLTSIVEKYRQTGIYSARGYEHHGLYRAAIVKYEQFFGEHSIGFENIDPTLPSPPPVEPPADTAGKGLDSQVVELLGRNRLTDEILRAGLEVAHPARDRGVDLVAYVDLETHVPAFVARPIQMKAASFQSFSIDRKYGKFPNLLIAFVWNLANGSETVTFAMSYAEALRIGDVMGYTLTDSWHQGSYATTSPSVRLRELLEPYRMTPERWWERVADGL